MSKLCVYHSPSTSVVKPQQHQKASLLTSNICTSKQLQPHTTLNVAAVPPVPSARTSMVIGIILCTFMYTFNGASSFNIDMYKDYSCSFDLAQVPSMYKLDFSAMPSLSTAVSSLHKCLDDIVSMMPEFEFQHDHEDYLYYTYNYNLSWSTEDNYKSKEMVFHGRYKNIRSTLDYTYHSNYTPERQQVQDEIIAGILNTNINITDSEGNSCTSPKNPWIVFTAGAMGSGKSYTIRHLASKNRFPLESFVTVDPDEIRRLLPEFTWYLDHNSEMAGEMTRKEAGFIAEMLTQIALRAGRNVLVDGSLKDADWYQDYFNILRKDFGEFGLKIGILHITAPRESVFERARMRSIITRRVVPRYRLEETLIKVPLSVTTLAPLVDFHAELHNAPQSDDIELVSEGMTWASFRQIWNQYCHEDVTDAADDDNDKDSDSEAIAWAEREVDYQMLRLLSKL